MPEVGDGVRNAMVERGDHPLSDEEYHQNSDGTSWSLTIGRLGRYYASNTTGDWEVIFEPFR